MQVGKMNVTFYVYLGRSDPSPRGPLLDGTVRILSLGAGRRVADPESAGLEIVRRLAIRRDDLLGTADDARKFSLVPATESTSIVVCCCSSARSCSAYAGGLA
jgi:hypothetical protein